MRLVITAYGNFTIYFHHLIYHVSQFSVGIYGVKISKEIFAVVLF